jgi:hypothetical protein
VRCQISGLVLRHVLKKRPDIEITKVEFLTNMDRAKEAGVSSIPTLVADGRSLTAIVLTPARIERFLETLPSESD